ncbi:RidA family protein [Sphingomonas sp. PAMC 26605]|uniref:RidA family protein n=1 Tax=Sphingomonas sp. PAMC 26605 TaxID=1112214 RepID=UPI00026CB5D5|nr:RidA family protein [Sphingomonas sp. PAMC 26605]
MNNRTIAPKGIYPPAGAYSHAVEIRGAGKTLYISGQLGVDPDGQTPDTFAAQATLCWRNIVAILAAAEMTVHDLVKVTTFLTDIGDARPLAGIREPFLEGARPASTLVAAAALVMPEWKIEVEAIAFKTGDG